MNSEAPLTRVIFFQVRDSAAKILRLAEAAQSHFEKKEPFLILTEDARSQQYVDELLWKHPETSFLPHIATDDPSADRIVIAKIKKNVNNARIAFNLCPTPLLIEGPFRIIYEFEDLTAPNKKHLSSLRYDAYKQAQFSIEAR